MIYKNITDEQLIRLIIDEVQKALAGNVRLVPVGISNRHVHLSTSDLEMLFGKGYQLTRKKDLSQPGQYAAEECVDVIGPKGELEKVRILGPVRTKTQVEISRTDCFRVGIAAPVRSSGDLINTPGCKLRGPKGEILINEGVIVADRHIHLSIDEARRFNLKDGDRVSVRIDGEKSGTMDNVLIRSNENASMDFHIDTDDANAFGLHNGSLVSIVENS